RRVAEPRVLLEQVLAAPGQDNRPAVLEQDERRIPADTAARAGDDRDLRIRHCQSPSILGRASIGGAPGPRRSAARTAVRGSLEGGSYHGERPGWAPTRD